MIRGGIMTDKVYEDSDTMAFLDANPSAPGHTLVIPKKHKENIIEMNEGEIADLFRTVKKVTEMIKNNLKPEGFNIGINQGQIAGQRVPHVHVHVIPRFPNDGGGMVQMVVNNKPKEDPVTIASKIRAGEELPDYIKRQIEDYEETEKKKELPEQEEKKDEEEEELEEKEKELFPHVRKETETEEESEEEEEDVYEKMLKRMRIPK